ncbi:hypothetical protein PGH47_42830 (plasmid) [Streptomyces sp. HUAS 31]|uniref:hypothetical protein n=1 Tax=Streptomyces sp. HUAS 31 TaxID=3020055 RepID=UPI0023052A06|nr:hypothetical protein [Streptomyces sp. HUAS 31]WCE02484.1 hypothetical protein PGH47_42830 [Streptomyces sp. HUAS 31]
MLLDTGLRDEGITLDFDTRVRLSLFLRAEAPLFLVARVDGAVVPAVIGRGARRGDGDGHRASDTHYADARDHSQVAAAFSVPHWQCYLSRAVTDHGPARTLVMVVSPGDLLQQQRAIQRELL